MLWGDQYSPIFKPLIGGLLPAPHPLLHSCLVWVCLNNLRAFGKQKSTTLITAIRLTPPTWLQVFCQAMFENHIVIPNA
jgi:hypothetical protein